MDFAPDDVRRKKCSRFIALSAVFAMVALFAATLGISQLTIGQEAWGVWGVPICLGLIALTYGAAFIGQGLGAEEMYMLRSFVDQALRNARARSACSAQGPSATL